ncbi:HNH endonuclease [Streptomyces sp. NPDC102340]|uniref:HNH endonuclease n=1 Tax=unclassified Streptomyces TaxID=2593676 RepID=UPI0037FE4D3A
MKHRTRLNSAMRRVRKDQLARRHGQRCTYCRRPFTDLSEATLDHVVPLSLWRTWSVTALMLACLDCNRRKADRLPLSLALLLVFTVGAPSTASVHGESADSIDLNWRLLARLAHANQSAYTATWTADRAAQRSTPNLHESTDTGAMRRSIGRPDCLRAPRPVRACSRPTGEAVPA